ncbi:ABC transporter ATP-binding protein [Granulicatella sp. 19428wC4_WM01]|nr:MULTISPECIES: ATP-binding cassette domain-containing protein [unclassified Granulicatella]MBF0779931.1 ABC transporter ATP-binding protein [Granulicatella sp. 19428wC4_WM01]
MKPLLTLTDVSKVYHKKDYKGVKHTTRALNHINLSIFSGETLGLVGESGSGKSTLGKIILGFEQMSEGKMHIYPMHNDKKEEIPLKRQIIFQDPYSALNPKMSALELVMEPLRHIDDKMLAQNKAIDMLARVGIMGDDVYKLPQHFSGGQRQRIGIARAVVSLPHFIVCDEPTSALDVSIQAQIIDLLNQLKKELSLSYLFISHNLAVVKHLCDRIAVMYQGHLIELAPTHQLFSNPQHEYTKKLLQASLEINPTQARLQLQNRLFTQDISIQLSETFEWIEVEPNHFVRKEL